MLKLVYYYNTLLLIVCFVLLLTVDRLTTGNPEVIPLFWIVATVTLYYTVLQACVVWMRRRKIHIKNPAFMALLLLELLPVGYIGVQILF